jgi:hypothetical protein
MSQKFSKMREHEQLLFRSGISKVLAISCCAQLRLVYRALYLGTRRGARARNATWPTGLTHDAPPQALRLKE